jgi:Rad3-related DNA helicase
MTTGVDFPYDQCRYQIIAKVPFPDTRNKVMAARTKEDPTYAHYIAMQTLVQMSGRGMRAADDACETIIVDDHAKWFIPKWRIFAPRWFMESFMSVNMVPRPIKLET